MKIIYYNKNIYINSNNISSFNLLLQCLEKLNISKKDIDNYYITSSEGNPLNYSQIIKNDKTYYLKRKLKGASALSKTGNSVPLLMFTAIVFGVVSVIYYWIYLKLIIGNISPDIDAKMKSFAVVNMKKHAAYTQSGGLSASEAKEKACAAQQKTKDFFCKIGCWIKENLQDQNVGKYLCYTRGLDPRFTTKEDEGSIASTLSSVTFFVYIFVMITTLFTNMATKAVCGFPKGKFLLMGIFFILIPIIIAFFSSSLFEGIDKLIKKLGKTPFISNYKLLFSNILLIFVLLCYMISNREGMTGLMWVILIPAIIVFTIFQYPIGGISIDGILSGLSTKISNLIIETTAYSTVPEYVNGIKYSPNRNPIPNSNKNRQDLYKHNIRECFDRFEFIYFILKAGLLGLIGFGFMTIIFGSQISKTCKK